MLAVEHQAPSHKVIQQRPHVVGYPKIGTNGSAYFEEVKFLLTGHVS